MLNPQSSQMPPRTFEDPQYWQVRINFRTTITMSLIKTKYIQVKCVSQSIDRSTRRDYLYSIRLYKHKADKCLGI